jgi:two-component system alkaline phosphatase synthesis response regulator PhoP
MKKLIFFIEDDLPTIEVYKISLESAGFEVQVIESGNKAVEEIKKIAEEGDKKPDLVLLDLILPDINGIEVLKEIRKLEETKDIPVFILTNYSDKKLQKAGFDLKSEKFLLKTDYRPQKLAELVKKRLK